MSIRQKIENDATLKNHYQLMETIPGFAPKTIPILVAFYGGPPRFDRAPQTAQFAG